MALKENIIEVSDATFDRDVLDRSQETPVVVDFWAPWCGPCRMLGPTLERLASEPDAGFVLAKVNVDDNQSLAMAYGVQGIPAVKAFYGGEVVDEFVGAQPEPMVRQFLQRIAPSEADRLLGDAERLLDAHQWEAAEAAFREILADDPDHPAGNLNLARALLAQGKGCAAQSHLDNVNDLALVADVEQLMPLARFLCTVEKAQENGDVPALEAQYRQAARLIAHGNLAAAMDGLLDVLREDKQYKNAKDVMLGLFALLGEEDDLTRRYRPELASVLF